MIIRDNFCREKKSPEARKTKASEANTLKLTTNISINNGNFHLLSPPQLSSEKCKKSQKHVPVFGKNYIFRKIV